MKTRNRWIMYSYQGFPGELTGRLTCHESLEWAKHSLERYARAVDVCESAYACLYPFTPEDWADAREFEHEGCPFNIEYARIIEYGPRGGLRISRT